MVDRNFIAIDISHSLSIYLYEKRIDDTYSS